MAAFLNCLDQLEHGLEHENCDDTCRFTDTEGELPVILQAHNEESRVLRAKIKQVGWDLIELVGTSQHWVEEINPLASRL